MEYIEGENLSRDEIIDYLRKLEVPILEKLSIKSIQ